MATALKCPNELFDDVVVMNPGFYIAGMVQEVKLAVKCSSENVG